MTDFYFLTANSSLYTSVLQSDKHLVYMFLPKCVRTSSLCSGHDPTMLPGWDPDALVARKDSVCVILPLYLTAIYYCSVTFTMQAPNTADKCPAPPESHCLHTHQYH